MSRKKKPYISLQDWMERTGTTADRLAQLSGLDRTHLSKILSGSRRCSLDKALRLEELTGVPVRTLVDWSRPDVSSQSDSAA
jgi:plasmid maintenance system antidote protein VapI